MDPFLCLLHKFSMNLRESEIASIKFLSRQKVGKRKLEEVQNGIDLFTILIDQNDISRSNVNFLREMFQSLKREDLLADLDKFEKYGSATEDLLDPRERERLSAAFDIICEHVGREWKKLIRTLGVTDTKIDSIVYAHPYDMIEQFRECLKAWQNIKRNEANVSELLKALRKCKLNLVADILSDKLQAMEQ
ncbi:FAS-associated death domain protein [Ornithorhynchus anatinus]|uniref:FAS-associated death domain protein n=1 Tax=Ornithorhynchus anatinus TaxID=9258 RepID=UPI0001554773|nr:FAS-associated death domain protein [Ornithorhynchus anatinus]XP_007656821.1 FAS-associated death domain protein [Ornithorhynchus anatinus]